MEVLDLKSIINGIKFSPRTLQEMCEGKGNNDLEDGSIKFIQSEKRMNTIEHRLKETWTRLSSPMLVPKGKKERIGKK